MRRWVLLLLGGIALADGRAARVGDPALERQIERAIDRGVAYLRGIQQPDGRWTRRYEEWYARDGDLSGIGGLTALSLYALASCGVAKDDPPIARGVEFLLAHPEAFADEGEVAVYANSTLVLALARIDPRAHRRAIHEAAQRLSAGQLEGGMWAYRLAVRTTAEAEDPKAPRRKGGPGLGMPDNSNTQFAALALWAAQAMAEYRVPAVTWRRMRDHFVRTQLPDGGWSYRSSTSRLSKHTMTAAGVMSLAYALGSLEPGGLAKARGNRSVQRGLDALPLDLANPWKKNGGALTYIDYYWAYSLERSATVLALDPASWYVPGARVLLRDQTAAGRWPARMPAAEGGSPYETSLALLFLTGATRALNVTRREAFVDASTPEGLARAFDLYAASNAQSRAALLPDLTRREMIGLAIKKLRDNLVSVRAAAFELLTLLLERPFLFDPAADPEERDVMLGPIDAFWAEQGERLDWDAEKGRFVAR